MMYKKKNAFWFSVWADCFKTSFYFTQKDVEKIAALPISETTKSEFLMQKPAGKLIPMIISTKDSQPLKDIDVMIGYKISKKITDMDIKEKAAQDEMIDYCIKYLNEFNGACDTKLSKEEAIAQMRKHFPTLKRWAY